MIINLWIVFSLRTVTIDDVIKHVKEKIPLENWKHFSIRLLVKKDQQLDQLSFVSFRISCTDKVFCKLMTPDMWPDHVMIGEFVEKPKPRTFGHFLPENTSNLQKKSTDVSGMETSPVNTPSKNVKKNSTVDLTNSK